MAVVIIVEAVLLSLSIRIPASLTPIRIRIWAWVYIHVHTEAAILSAITLRIFATDSANQSLMLLMRTLQTRH